MALSINEIREFVLKITGNQNDLEEKIQKIYSYYYTYVQMQPYRNSKNRLVQLMIEEGFPTVERWNEIAYQEDLFSSISIKYIEECSWKELEKKLKGEVKDLIKE